MSSTSSLTEFDEIKRQDKRNWLPHYLNRNVHKTKLI